MRIVRADPLDRATTQVCFEVLRAAAGVDDPGGPPWSLRRLRGWLEHPTDPNELWTAVDETTGACHGWYRLTLPERENRDRGYLWVTVGPSWRRRGTGTALVGHAADQAAAAGRSVLASGTSQGTAGAAFAARLGATAGLVDARRVLVLGRIPAGRVAQLRSQAAAAAAGYSLVRWDGRTPDEYLARYAELENAMADAPHEAGEENAVWDADRVRAEIDDKRELQGRHAYTLAALHDASGEMAAVTSVEPDQDFPAWGHQQITAVTRKHRGHRLGLLVKTAMVEWLAAVEPGIERIVTYNAAANDHMIAINAELGYEVLEPLDQTYELPVAPRRSNNESRHAGTAGLARRHAHRTRRRVGPGDDRSLLRDRAGGGRGRRPRRAAVVAAAAAGLARAPDRPDRDLVRRRRDHRRAPGLVLPADARAGEPRPGQCVGRRAAAGAPPRNRDRAAAARGRAGRGGRAVGARQRGVRGLGRGGVRRPRRRSRRAGGGPPGAGAWPDPGRPDRAAALAGRCRGGRILAGALGRPHPG